MSDATDRTLEREAALGDEHAQERLLASQRRRGQGRHADKIGEWIMIAGVRDSYRGRLIGVTETGGGKALLHLAPCYWLDYLGSTKGEIKTPASEDHPFDILSDAAAGVCLQVADWPKQ